MGVLVKSKEISKLLYPGVLLPGVGRYAMSLHTCVCLWPWLHYMMQSKVPLLLHACSVCAYEANLTHPNHFLTLLLAGQKLNLYKYLAPDAYPQLQDHVDVTDTTVASEVYDVG